MKIIKKINKVVDKLQIQKFDFVFCVGLEMLFQFFIYEMVVRMK